jgi:hypothetical protein
VAAGGETAIRAVKTRAMAGDLVTGAGRAALEIVQMTPNRFLRVIDSPVSGRSENGFDGATAWTRNQRGTRDVTGPELGMLLRELHLYRPFELRGLLCVGDAAARGFGGRSRCVRDRRDDCGQRDSAPRTAATLNDHRHRLVSA